MNGIRQHKFDFREAPAFVNAYTCRSSSKDSIDIATTLDENYLQGTMAAVFSTKHKPKICRSVNSTFPYLKFEIYRFDSTRVRGKISKSVRQALDQPLNYARIYLANILPSCVHRVIYLDSDVIVVDDVSKLREVVLDEKVIAAPEYCHANFTNYFTESFWSDKELSRTFEGRRLCYFSRGVMILDVNKWRKEGYTQRVEEWMVIQKQKRMYNLGSLPPFLLIFAGNIKTSFLIDGINMDLVGITLKANVEAFIPVRLVCSIRVEKESHG
ncbi:hypothetical protein Cgig2_000238 [Carnegiea gigantea]|uniref:Hexosyltransferase n=1 Tax=Carnegiea gigantea TaxID=171969 RepID=A0A9Q1JKQ5_9CARY|nr:hypothetical protein Cgig2_000238 [Carnegiea gigantea]